MNADLKRRLNKLQQRIRPSTQTVLIFIHDTDPPGTVEDRLTRWKNGESIKHGNDITRYEGGEFEYGVVKFVSAYLGAPK